MCRKALAPLLVQRTLEGLRPVQCITCFNGCLSAGEAEFGAVAYTEGHAVRVPVRQLIAFRQDILCFVIARIHYLIKIGRRLQDRLDIRVRVGVGYTPVFGKDTVVVPVHGDDQKADRILGIGVYIAVRRNKAVISSGCSVLLYFAVYRYIIILYAPHIALQQVGLIIVGVLQSDGKDHLLPACLISVKVAHGNGLNITVGDSGGAACTVIGALEVIAGIYRHRLIVAGIIERAAEEHQLLCAAPLAVDCNRLHSQLLPYIIGIMVAAVCPAVGLYGLIGSLNKTVSRIAQFPNIEIPSLHVDGFVHLLVVFFPCSQFPQHTCEEQIHITIAVKISAGQRGSHRKFIAITPAAMSLAGVELLALCRGFGHDGAAGIPLCTVDDLDHRTVVVDLGLVFGQPVTVGQHRQIVHTVAVEVPHGHGDTQLAPLIALRVLHIIPRMVVIIAHQQAVALAAFGERLIAAIVVPFLNLTAACLIPRGLLRSIDHDAFLAVTVKVTGHDIEEAAVGVGRNLKIVSIKHIAEVANLYLRAAV